MELQAGIKPNLHPGPAEINRYAAFLGSAAHRDTDAHVTIEAPHQAIYAAFKSIRKYQFHRDYGQKIAKISLQDIYQRSVDALIARELEILDPQWQAYGASLREGHLYGRERRRLKRVATGSASLLLRHGRDGKSTGFSEIDSWYRRMWKHADGSNYLDDLYDAIAQAEYDVTIPV